jgi:hypothetical protein
MPNETTIVTQELADRILKYEIEAHLSRVGGMQSVTGNPLSVAVQQFGGAYAFIVRGSPYMEMSRVIALGPAEEKLIGPVLAWFREQDSPCNIDISPHHSDETLLQRLARRGLYQARFQTILFGIPAVDQPAAPVGVSVHDYSNRLDEFAALAVEIDGIPELDRDVWTKIIKAQFAGWRCYVALVGGMPAGHAAMYIKNNVASLMYAGTRVDYRGYGCQTALLRHRLGDAAASNCDLVVCSTIPGTVSQRNQERAGLRIAYTKAIWTHLDT